MSDFDKEMKAYVEKLGNMLDEGIDEEETKILQTMCRRLSAITAVRISRDACKEMTEEQLAEQEENACKGYTDKALEACEYYKGMTEGQLAEQAKLLARTGGGLSPAVLLIRFSVLVAVYFRRKAEKPKE